MYAGRIVETGAIDDVFTRPAHPYTVGLMNSIPRLDQIGSRLSPIVGSPPSLADIPPGCAFHPRCPRAQDVCRVDDPALLQVVPGRRSACHFAKDVLGV
jgi:oligopeptide transport system ATP-binding protein